LGYISARLAYSKLRERYKAQLVALLGSDDPDAQRAGLNGLRFVKAKEAVTRMIELSRSRDLTVVDSASLALAHYDTAETAAALIALTRHETPEIRCRACVDLSSSRRPESKAALAAMLDDKAVEVRAIAPRGLVYLLRAGAADDLLPQLATLLKDPDGRVRVRAADALGETRNVQAIPPLLEVLQAGGISRELKYSVLGALECHYSKDDPPAKPLVEKHMDLVIAALRDDNAEAGFGPSFHAVGILSLCRLPEAKAALEWAVKSHPNQEIRSYAQRSLAGQ
jgi:HEAT repeat protein